jgi:hypothetical protein
MKRQNESQGVVHSHIAINDDLFHRSPPLFERISQIFRIILNFSPRVNIILVYKVTVQLHGDLDRGVKPGPGGTVFKTLECGYLTGAVYEAEGGSRGFVHDSSPEGLQKRCRPKLFPTAPPSPVSLLLFPT